MQKIVLIICASKKQMIRSKAEEFYISPLFKLHLSYARSLNPDQIYILSAKHGVLSLEDVIGPDDECLNEKNTKEVKQWAERIVRELERRIDMKHDEVIFLAGERYRKDIIPHLENYRIPLQGLPIGKQLQYLNQQQLKKGNSAQE